MGITQGDGYYGQSNCGECHAFPILLFPMVGCCLFKCCPDQRRGVHWNHSVRWLLPVKLWRMPCISNPSILKCCKDDDELVRSLQDIRSSGWLLHHIEFLFSAQRRGVHWNHSVRWLLPVKLWRMPCISNPSISAGDRKVR